MKTNPESSDPSELSRRQFLKSSTAAAIAGPFATSHAFAQGRTVPPGETLRVGLIGCGGRGTGAAAQALAADSNVKLVALGDAFKDRLQGSLETLKKQQDISAKIEVPEDRCFVGFDAYKQVIASGVDVVLLATPPHFRPIHLKAAIEAGKHVFAEKPVAVDAPGVRSVLATCEEARKRKLAVVSGLALRYSNGYRETIKRIHDGAIGDVTDLRAYWVNGGPIWHRAEDEAKSTTELERQIRNWYHYIWLCGDHCVEQHVHNIDICNWVANATPVKAWGLGARQMLGNKSGEIWDNFAFEFEYATGVRMHSFAEKDPSLEDVFVLVTKGLVT
jgi:predicted dehydrogenase